MKNYFDFKKEALLELKNDKEYGIGALLNLVNLYLTKPRELGDESVYEHTVTDDEIPVLKHYSKALLEDLFHNNQITLEHRGKEIKTQEEFDKAFEEQWVDGYPSDPLDDEYLIIKPKKKFSIF